MSERIFCVVHKPPSSKPNRMEKILPPKTTLLPLRVDHKEDEYPFQGFPLEHAEHVAKHKHAVAMETLGGEQIHLLFKQIKERKLRYPSPEDVILITHDVHVVRPTEDGGVLMEKPRSFDEWRKNVETISEAPWVIVGSYCRSFPLMKEIPKGSFNYFVSATTGPVKDLVEETMTKDPLFSERVEKTSGGLNFSLGFPWFSGLFSVRLNDSNTSQTPKIITNALVEHTSTEGLEQAIFGFYPELLEGLFNPHAGIHDTETIRVRQEEIFHRDYAPHRV